MLATPNTHTYTQTKHIFKLYHMPNMILDPGGTELTKVYFCTRES